MRILIAPDSFKNSLTSKEAADAIEAGVLNAVADAKTIKVAIADGGEGCVEAIAEHIGGVLHSVCVHDPLNRLHNASFLYVEELKLAVIEMASASGLMLLKPDELDPLHASTYGTGELIKAALDLGCKQILIGIGGSATNDGGIGMAQALGYRFYDKENHLFTNEMSKATDICRIDDERLDPRLKRCHIQVAGDVFNVLCGSNGSSIVFGAQKGADAKTRELLDHALEHLNQLVLNQTGVDYGSLEGAGAAGGLGFGLMAFAGAEIYSGIDLILSMIDFEAKVKEVDLIITGEGRTDGQTAYGKAVCGIARMAKKYGKPVICLSGAVSQDCRSLYECGVTAVFDAALKPMSLTEAIASASENLTFISESILRIYKIEKD